MCEIKAKEMFDFSNSSARSKCYNDSNKLVVELTATGFKPTTTQFVNEYSS